MNRFSFSSHCPALVAVLLLVGCGAPTDEAPTDTAGGAAVVQEQQVGADRDEHGCIGSAGYSWCAATESCERPWELAEREGFENTEEAFAAFCDAAALE